MKFNEAEYETFSLSLKERGYHRGKDGANKHVDHCWYKTFRRGHNDNDRGYVIALNVYDNSDLMERYPTLSRFSMDFNMTMNHQTRMDFDRCDFSLMRDAMILEEFEGYCDRLYDCMLEVLPHRNMNALTEYEKEN
jgi:hypothetical protein